MEQSSFQQSETRTGPEGQNAPLGTGAGGSKLPGVPAAASPEMLRAFAESYGLTKRETELLAYAYQRYSARRIGESLYITEGTVYAHLKSIYRKTGTHSREQLADHIDTWVVAR